METKYNVFITAKALIWAVEHPGYSMYCSAHFSTKSSLLIHDRYQQ